MKSFLVIVVAFAVLVEATLCNDEMYSSSHKDQKEDLFLELEKLLQEEAKIEELTEVQATTTSCTGSGSTLSSNAVAAALDSSNEAIIYNNIIHNTPDVFTRYFPLLFDVSSAVEKNHTTPNILVDKVWFNRIPYDGIPWLEHIFRDNLFPTMPTFFILVKHDGTLGGFLNATCEGAKFAEGNNSFNIRGWIFDTFNSLHGNDCDHFSTITENDEQKLQRILSESLHSFIDLRSFARSTWCQL